MSRLKGESLKIIAIIMIGWTCFAFADAFIKHLSASYNPSLIAAYGAGINVIILSIVIIYLYGLKGFKWNNPLWCFIRLISSGIISCCVVQALSRMPIADMYGIVFSSPFIGVILAYLLLKEQVGWHRWVSIAIGFLGVLIIIGPQFEHVNMGILFAMFAALFMGVNNTIIRKIGKQENTVNLSLLAFIGQTLVNTYVAWDDIDTITINNALLFSGQGFLILAGVLLTTYGISHAKNAASIAPFLYVQAIWGVVFGYIFFDDIPTAATILGLIIVVGAGLYMIYREKQLGKK